MRPVYQKLTKPNCDIAIHVERFSKNHVHWKINRSRNKKRAQQNIDHTAPSESLELASKHGPPQILIDVFQRALRTQSDPLKRDSNGSVATIIRS